ncbi:unconventional myosin-IXb-like, partial [Sceloporus undulatus]|uniref:unconventional myosin-IXb-like n=1 Tax=Sceloporus undulatus TaxID=8520 RepID=UPI001C4CDAB3
HFPSDPVEIICLVNSQGGLPASSFSSLLQKKNAPQDTAPDSGTSPKLGFLPEEEEEEADNREKELLTERIQSLKEEKEDLTYRLPELDQRGSDEENLDSETSASTESLLEDRVG